MTPSTVDTPDPDPAAAAPLATNAAPSNTGLLHIIGLGLGSEDDITLKGLRLVRSAAAVYLENYTSILAMHDNPAACRDDPTAAIARLRELYGRDVVVADRQYVEERAADILADCSRPGGVAFLVVGDPFGATTHSDLWLRAKERGITVNVVHNASIVNAVAVTGLQLYRFGETVSICLWSELDRPTGYIDKIVRNRNANLHTLCLLDIKVKEPSLQSLLSAKPGRKPTYMPPTFMSIQQAIRQIIDIDNNINNTHNFSLADSYAVAVARLGDPSQRIVYASFQALLDTDMGPPLHSLIIPAPTLHFHEREVLQHFAAPGVVLNNTDQH